MTMYQSNLIKKDDDESDNDFYSEFIVVIRGIFHISLCDQLSGIYLYRSY